MKREKNKVKVILTQDIPASVNVNGFSEDTHNEAEFSDESTSEIDSRKLGLWVLCVVKQFVELARLQGKKGFNLNKPIDMLIKVNAKEAKVRFKFSLNIEKLLVLAQRNPELIAVAFRPVPSIGALSGSKALEYLTTDKPFVIAESTTKKEKSLSIVTEKLSLSDVELTEDDLAEIL